ncbi:hypothetical protein [Paenarthrobacter sp. NPDC018779]|uniref:hypothetical protein n=1 Tax=Paenarthrobacter sp. NPDC018779 TaxID=3364375 RepID=UPI0037C90EA6
MSSQLVDESLQHSTSSGLFPRRYGFRKIKGDCRLRNTVAESAFEFDLPQSDIPSGRLFQVKCVRHFVRHAQRNVPINEAGTRGEAE